MCLSQPQYRTASGTLPRFLPGMTHLLPDRVRLGRTERTLEAESERSECFRGVLDLQELLLAEIS